MATWRQSCPKQLTEVQLRAVTAALLLMVISAVVDIASAAALDDRQQSIDLSSGGSAAGRSRREVEKRAPRLASWGKRDPETDGQLTAELAQGAPEIPDDGYVEAEADRDKRPARLASWGKKRVDGGSLASGLDRFAADKSPRSKWSSGSMSVWGKRSANGLDDEYYNEDREKRNSKWSGNNLAVWGKRDEDEKRGWANKNNMAVWG